MGTPFKIPKKKQLSEPSSLLMMSPLSKVQLGDTEKARWTLNGKRVHKNSSVNGQAGAGVDRSSAQVNGTPAKAGWTPNSRLGARSPAGEHTSLTEPNRWRPKRASDSLFNREGDKDVPVIKKQWRPCLTSISQLEDEEEDGEKQATFPWKETKGPSTEVARQPQSTSNLRSTPPTSKVTEVKRNGERTQPSSHTPEKKGPEKCLKTLGTFSVPFRNPGTGWSRTGPARKLKLILSHRKYQKAKPAAEPIVLSSDEDEGANEGHSNSQTSTSAPLNKDHRKTSPDSYTGGQSSEKPSVMELAFSTLHFGTTRSLANGPIVITEESISIPLKADNDDDDDDGVVLAVVASELHGFGVWDGALVSDGALLSTSQQPSPSLLFLILSNSQTTLLTKELSALHQAHTHGQPCPFLLVTLAGQLDELQTALLASLMDMIGLRNGRPFLGVSLSWAAGLNRLHDHPRGGQLLTLLGQGDRVDSQQKERERTNKDCSSETKSSNADRVKKASEITSIRHTSLRSHTRQQNMPRRLVQYPPPPSKGGITVTTEDLECLRDGEFLNDVIIDFYLKYLQLERADKDVADRSHIFSSFFYKQLTRRDNSSEEGAVGTAQYRRHRRVKTWTRHVDIFSKDYLFIPVNQEAHWYLVVICFPGLLQDEVVPWKRPTSVETSHNADEAQQQSSSKSNNQTRHQTGHAVDPKGRLKEGVLGSHDLPDCTVRSCQRETVTRRPCILIMDSLKLSYHYRIYTLLREYLQMEWEVRRGTPRAFTDSSIRGSHCKVPMQDNSSDCGLYLLQYVESFLQNPVVHFELPLRLDRWFPRQQVRRKREELRELVLQLYQRQGGGSEQGSR